MNIATNHVLIEFDKSRDDTFTTESGFTLYVPTMKQDETDPNMETDSEAIRTWGKVIAVPFKNTNSIFVPVVKKVGRKEMQRTAADIALEVKEGDIIHFRYTVLETQDNRLHAEGKDVVIVPYPDIFGIEKEDGSIHPIGSYVFIEPIKDKIVESDSVIIPEGFNKKETPKGRVLYIGSPFKDEAPIDVKPGDVVLYNNKLAERHKLRNDKWVRIIYQSDIHAILDDYGSNN